MKNARQMKMDVASPARSGNISKTSERRGSLSGSGSWIVLLLLVATWAGIFGTVFSRTENDLDRAEEQLSLSVSGSNRSVLGVTEGASDSQAIPEENDADSISQEVSEQLSEAEQLDAEEIQSVVDELEEERKDKLRILLSLDLPREIDNPNFPISFVEPTENGVEIQVDGEGFAQAMSPYSLPSVGIGEHVIDFRFQDSEGISQNLEETFVVIPRPPVWEAGQKKEYSSGATIELSGTALPNSRVIVLISETLKSAVSDVDSDGNWKVRFDEEFDTGEYSVIAFVRKSGFTSNFSETHTFSVGMVEGVSDDAEDDASEDEAEVDRLFGVIPYTEDNYPYVIAIIGLIAIVLVLLMSGLFRAIGRARREDAMWVARRPSRVSSGNGHSETLREKFRKAGIGVGNGVKNGDTDDTNTSVIEEKDDVNDNDEGEKEEKIEPDTRDKKLRDKVSAVRHDQESRDENEEQVTGEKITERKEDDISKDKTSLEDAEEQDSEKESAKHKPTPRVYSKDEFLKKFDNARTTTNKETNKLRISLTSNKGS